MIHVTFFFFNDTATTEIYTLSLHDALPISGTSVTAHSVITTRRAKRNRDRNRDLEAELAAKDETIDTNRQTIDSLKERSEEHTSELQSPDHLVCRLLLEKKKNRTTTNRKSS